MFHQHNDADKIESLKNLIGKHGINMRDSRQNVDRYTLEQSRE